MISNLHHRRTLLLHFWLSQHSWSKNPRQHRNNFVAILLSGYDPAVWFRGSHRLIGSRPCRDFSISYGISRESGLSVKVALCLFCVLRN